MTEHTSRKGARRKKSPTMNSDPVIHAVHPGVVRRQLHLSRVGLHCDDVATPARDAAAALSKPRAQGQRERWTSGGERSIACLAANWMGLPPQSAKASVTRSRGAARAACDGLRGASTCLRRPRSYREKRLYLWRQYFPAKAAAASSGALAARASTAFSCGSSAASTRFGSCFFGLATSRVDSGVWRQRRRAGFLEVAPRRWSGVLLTNGMAQAGRRRRRGASLFHAQSVGFSTAMLKCFCLHRRTVSFDQAKIKPRLCFCFFS
jgi:hypothetical protein